MKTSEFPLSKEKELKMLENLCKSDSYFSQFFAADFDQMASNIRNDFAIEMNTKFSIEAEGLKAKVKFYEDKVNVLSNDFDEMVQTCVSYRNADIELQHQIESLKADREMILNLLVYNQSIERVTDPCKSFTKDEILRSKVLQSIDLSSAEKNELLMRSGLI